MDGRMFAQRERHAMRSARQDINTVESWGYSRQEALEFVTRRAIAEAQRATDRREQTPDRAVLEQHLAYLAELRVVCLTSLQHDRLVRHA